MASKMALGNAKFNGKSQVGVVPELEPGEHPKFQETENIIPRSFEFTAAKHFLKWLGGYL